MPREETRLAVFDLDGTLVDAFEDIAEAINTPLRKRGYPEHSVDSIKRMVGEGAGKLIERATPGMEPEMVEEVRQEMLAKYIESPADNAAIYPGVFDLLEDLLDWGIVMGILSNKPHEMTVKTCEVLGLSRYFQDIVGEDAEASPRKPDPMGLESMIERAGATRAVLIGDGAADGQVAQNAGVPFIACLWGTRNREQLAEFAPVGFAESPAELEKLITDTLR